MMYPKPVRAELNEKQAVFHDLKVCGICSDLFEEAARICGFPASRADTGSIRIEVDRSIPGIEAYEITVGDDAIVLRGCSEEAAARGIWTLLEMIRPAQGGWAVPTGMIRDEAFKPMRGVHLYLPPSDGIEECKRFLAVLARLKYNAVILEIGGVMAYERHPEINRAWTRFCREARRHAGGPRGLQASEAYWKDSTHIEMAGGGCLKKSEIAELVQYCRLLRLEVIPEIQGLSHAYYLTLADRSIAERPFERWPDSYCPCNERSYELYFDCAEEILETIRPKRVSIGHDEVRVLGECPLCRKKSGAELLANDINRLHEFYRQREVRIMMWGEMLQNSENFKGIRTGGVEIPERTDRYGRKYKLLATHQAIRMIPRDILILDWHYAQGDATEAEFKENGFSEIFGNFKGSTIANWQERANRGNVQGAEVSTWCLPNEDENGRNGWFYELAFSSAVLWRSDYSDECRTAWDKSAEKLLPELKAIVRGEKPAFDGTEKTLASLILPQKKKPADDTAVKVKAEAITTLSEGIAARLAAGGLSAGSEFTVDAVCRGLVLFHAAENVPEEREFTWYFLDPAPRIPASYAIDYDDGLTIRFPVEFPVMAGSFGSDASYVRPVGDEAFSEDIDDDRRAKQARPAPVYAPKDVWRSSAVYFSRSAAFTVQGNTRTVYAWEWKNPRPEAKVRRIRLIDEEKSAIRLLCFGIGIL